MRTINYNKSEMLSKITYAFFLAFALLFSSCEKDEDSGGYFELKDSPTKMEASAQASSETYSFKSSGRWKIEPLRKEKWLNIEPLEGEGDGTFTVTVSKNAEDEIRTMTLFFTVDGHLQNNVLKVEQAAAINGGQEKDPYLKIDDISDRLEVLEAGHTGKYILRATGKWKLDIEEEIEWLSIEPMEGTGDTPVTISINRNTGVERTANLLFFLNEVQQSNGIAIYQKGVKLQEEGDVVLSEDFSWLNYGSTIFNVTTGETRISLWSAGELEKGWTSTINPTTGGGDYASIYARAGFIKLGRTNYGGDLISPQLSTVQGTKNLKVTFKAAVYMTAGGTVDHDLLKVGVTGPGTVSVSEFSITHKPDYTADPNCTELWKKPEAIKTFIITGATNQTKVWFLGGDFDITAASGWPKNVNRIFLDDIEVTVIK